MTDTNALPVHAAGFALDESVVDHLRSFVQETSQRCGLELKTLEGISIAENFRRFASEFDTGFGPQDRPDVSDVAVGVTPQVLRNGQLASHVILPRSIITAFMSANQPQQTSQARYTISHELAHADEHHKSAKKFAPQLVELHVSPKQLEIGRRAVWSEYYVCRKVASLEPPILSELEEQLARSTEEFSNDCATPRARIAASGDKAGVHGRLCSCAFGFFLDVARLLGHLDGLDSALKTECRIVADYLADANLTEAIEDLHRVLRVLWDTFPHWSSLEDLQPILVVMDTILKKL